MAKVEPFNGIRYSDGAAENVLDLLAPPYDVINAEQQQALYDRSPHNCVRLILGKINDDDTDENNRYSRSAATLAEWLESGVLRRDEKPALYLYAQDFDVEGKRLRRTGFICRRLVDDFGDSVHPHERTLAGPKIDRLNLTRACKVNFSQVFGLYADPSQTLDAIWATIMERPADISVVDDDNEGHHLWAITDGATIATVQDFMEERDVVIADGHHRYTTAINYRKERRAEAGDPAELQPFDYAMMFLANSNSEGFTVLATHRCATDIDTPDETALLEKLRAFFNIASEKVDETTIGAFMETVEASGKTAPSFGLYSGNGSAHLLTFTGKEEYLAGQSLSSNDEALATLDVSILQNLIFEKIVGISREAVAAKKNVSYTISPTEVMKRVDSGAAQLGFLLNPTEVDEVIAIATGGGVMPQKSTYFYPKLITGLVMNPIY